MLMLSLNIYLIDCLEQTMSLEYIGIHSFDHQKKVHVGLYLKTSIEKPPASFNACFKIFRQAEINLDG